MAQELLTLQNLAKYYTSAQSVVVGLNQLNLTFRRGEFVAITGESGSGKSTLSHVLSGILPYEGGELLYKGRPTSHYDSGDWERYRRDCASFISQSYGILPGSSVLDNVTCALRLVGLSKEQAQTDAEEILKKVELWDLRHRRAAKLSSGQKQRLSIARALAKPAPILIADEPTGNLDAENSAMVISLLAEAAQDRLVILITHEFSEAEDYVTRHIELHDGRVTMDVQLREVPRLPDHRPGEKRASGKEKKRLGWFVARFQIKARPVWALLMLALFALTVFAMFAFSGTFISNLDDTFTYIYDNSAFRNGDDRRIVVARPDGRELTGQDLEEILSLRYVEAVEEYGYVTDIQYAYREGVDYEVKHTLESTGGLDATYYPVSYYSVANTQKKMPFLRTVPILPEGRKFLTAGRLPENLYEVVAVGGEELLGEKLTVLLQDQKNWSVTTFVLLEFTVVGVTDYGSHLYFHSDMGRMMLTSVRNETNFVYMPMPNQPYLLGIDNTVTNGTVVYKYISGNVTGGDAVAAGVAQQAAEKAMLEMDYLDSFLKSFFVDTGEYAWNDKWNELNWLGYYAEDWGVDPSPLLELRVELGLDQESLREMDTSAMIRQLENLLSDPEIIARLQTAAEPLLRELEAALAREQETLSALDLEHLTFDEAVALLEKWGGEAPNVRPVQPGEAVVSQGVMTSILFEHSRGKQPMTRAEREKAEAEAEFAVYRFPDVGAMMAAQFSQDTDGGGEVGAQPGRDLTVIGLGNAGFSQVVLLHPQDFAAMTYAGPGDQISVFVEDYAYVDRVLDALHGLDYAALSPYQEGAVEQDPTLAEQRMQTLRVCLIALLAVIVLQILLLRAMFSMETESYRLLSHIGLNGVTAQRSVLWQIMLFALGGQAVGIGLITACAAGGMDQVVTILRYLPLSYRIVLCVIHLCASAFTAVWTMRTLKKQVFPQSGAEPDLDWDVLEEVVEA